MGEELGVGVVVGKVGEEGAAGSEAGGVDQGAAEGEVGGVRARTEHVEHQEVEAAHEVEGGGGDFVDVGEVGEGAALEVDAQTVGLDGAVDDGEGGEACAEGLEGRGDRDEVDERTVEAEGVAALGDVGEDAVHAGDGVGTGIAGNDGVALHGVETADVVEAEKVVGVGVGDEDGIDTRHAAAQALGAEVGPRVEQKRATAERDERGGTEAFIARIPAPADLAPASNQRHPRGGAGP